MQWLHKTIGLFVGAWLMLMGLSGALLSFYPEIDSALNRHMLRVDHAVSSPDIDGMKRVVSAAYPDRTVLYLERYGVSDHESYPFFLTAKHVVGAKPSHDPEWEVFVDPDTHAILGDRGYWTWFRLVRSFHMELLFAGLGERIVGVLGLFLLVTSIVGVVLWWRESKRRVGAALKPRLTGPLPVVLRSVHTVGGIYVAIFLILQSTSGALAANLFPLEMWIGKTFAPHAAKPKMSPPAPPAAGAKPPTPLTANQARDIALSFHPNRR